VVYPVLGPIRVEIRYSKPDKWFKEVDTNNDLRIDVIELARYFEKLKFKETNTLIQDLKT
jgi:hypothetical protein